MNYSIITLGCAKNQVDAEIMQGLLLADGFVWVDDVEQADVIVINTCGFIEAAKEESIEAILEAATYKSRHLKALVVAGCLSQRYAEELTREIPEIDGLVGTGNFSEIVSVVGKALRGERTVLVGESNYAYNDPVPRVTSLAHTAYVKIAEGCDNRCSYCAIPIVRGSFRSRNMESIVREVEELAARGVQEINLIAQDTTRYGLDNYGFLALPALLRRLLSIPGPRWFRLLYCYPAQFSQELIELIGSEQRILKYVDLPLQHINARILQQMKRRGTPEEIRDLIQRLRTGIAGLTLRTTFIVGFPGETAADFQELYSFVEETRFDHLGVFKYSQEEDTEAYDLADQVDEETKESRRQSLMALQLEISQERNSEYQGQVLDVLVEEQWPEGRGVIGRAEKDAPEVDGLVYIRDVSAEPGDFVRVRVEETLEYDLVGVKADDPC
jgi:ribosomal protein S12 methylthiotransferase